MFVRRIESAWWWCGAAAVCFILADQINGWSSLVPVTVGLGCGLYGLTSYLQGRDGLSKYRQ
jgi:hypothetical protein